MQKKEILTSLQSIQQDLSRQSGVDQETLEHLHSLVANMEKLVQRAEALRKAEVEPIASQWQQTLRRFESEHPHLTDLIARVTDGLANLGI